MLYVQYGTSKDSRIGLNTKYRAGKVDIDLLNESRKQALMYKGELEVEYGVDTLGFGRDVVLYSWDKVEDGEGNFTFDGVPRRPKLRSRPLRNKLKK
jgi:hypothetical protein